jgi:hypothetical protein
LAARSETGAQTYFGKAKPSSTDLRATMDLPESLEEETKNTIRDHVAGTTGAPFPAGERGQITVNVIDPRGSFAANLKRVGKPGLRGFELEVWFARARASGGRAVPKPPPFAKRHSVRGTIATL